jgi:hypothetical protein
MQKAAIGNRYDGAGLIDEQSRAGAQPSAAAWRPTLPACRSGVLNLKICQRHRAGVDEKHAIQVRAIDDDVA